ncbi:Energy-coupling factor transporter transmembrane protein EcfT [Methanosarcinaceae archaeon Ag5]|uniref:Energy-coupling factor transporter transmembrane protein EcfT n=1 Tax=Methanolapillus africanus TaxID=3028297 RepID=A0AAE4SD85_9EURY|nr:Energy-coupling factor transporter transmembrane protein EcfT [Methanosarcinaceae archaeon Ag5]
MMYKKYLSYESGKSFFHKLDPRTKIIALMVISLIIFSERLFVGLIMIAVLFLICAFISRVSVRKLFLSVRPMLFFIVLVFLLHFLFTNDPFAANRVFLDIQPVTVLPPDQVLYNDPTTPFVVSVKADSANDYHFISPSVYSFVTGIGTALKFLLLILFAALVTATTKQSDLIQGVDKLFRPVLPKRIGFTSHDLAVMVLLTVRFIPLLIVTGRQITTSAISRGFEIKRHPLRYTKILAVGLVSSIILFSSDVSFAMENRGYTGNERTYMNELKMKKKDYAFLVIFALLCLQFIFVFIYFLFQNPGMYQYFFTPNF